MRISQFFISTFKEAPAEAELVSHKLMLRAGLIKRLGSGLFTWMPLGLRVLQKIEKIVREEMNKSGAIELLMPAIQPAELWQETERWNLFGAQMLKIKDRHEHDFCFGPTHEEVITDIARKEIKSYRQLPIIFYQIQTKFRDEIRPRFGVMRAREFIMKDAYSFHTDIASLQHTYQIMHNAYQHIFSRLGLNFRTVAADSGTMGGSSSHEFHVLADSGEDEIAFCPDSDYAANIELATTLPPANSPDGPDDKIKMIATPGKKTCADVANFLNQSLQDTVKAIAVVANDKFFLLLLRGDHQLNEVKVRKIPYLANFEFAREEEIIKYTGSSPGYIGPVGLEPDFIIADNTVVKMKNFICGANKEGFHFTGVNFNRDIQFPEKIYDIRNVVAGDASPDGKGNLKICKGIEVGHIFQLHTKYSKAMKADFLDHTGHIKTIEMGCYGIGISRIMAAAIEQNHDDKGIIFPISMAPFQLVIIPIGMNKSNLVKTETNRLYQQFTAVKIDILLDDRNERPGVMFADMELIGIPHRLIISERGLKNATVEYQGRKDKESQAIPLSNIVSFISSKLCIN